MPGEEAGDEVLEQSVIDAGAEAIRLAFQAGASDAEGPSRLVKRLEETLGLPRDQWPPSALCALWDPLLEVADARLRSARHESRWLNLAGYFLRPGLGFPLDANRIKALWPTFHNGVRHVKDTQTWVEWWVLWRRVTAGLNRAHHEEIHRRLAPLLQPPKGGTGKKATRPKPEAHELREMWRCSASLERLPASVKESLGESLVRDLKFDPLPNHVLWCLGRFGARVPLFGPANTVIPAGTANRWVESILARAYKTEREIGDAIFALSQIAGVSGDRVRDLDPTLREQVAQRLQALGADPHAISSVREFQERATQEQSQALGDALPVGLRLRSETEVEGV